MAGRKLTSIPAARRAVVMVVAAMARSHWPSGSVNSRIIPSVSVAKHCISRKILATW